MVRMNSIIMPYDIFIFVVLLWISVVCIYVCSLSFSGIKLIIELIPNHTGDESYWFRASSNKSHHEHSKYKDYYIWRNRTDANKSNWVIV